MALIEDKNLFIGICTRKELVIRSDQLSNIPFSKKKYAATNHFEWKTSDWIIQEIGLAKGRNLEVLLLIEDGVRKPGGLQGDVEYIPFTRSGLEASFGKIVEMIAALNPKTALTVEAPNTSAQVRRMEKKNLQSLKKIGKHRPPIGGRINMKWPCFILCI